MKVTKTGIPDVLILEPRIFEDKRGFFMETWNKKTFKDLGLDVTFVQDNYSKSVKNTLRGLHYQIHKSQGKLIRVIRGEIYDVAVDLRQNSPTLGKWISFNLSEKNNKMIWIPAGFAHGFLVLSASAEFEYKCTEYYKPELERCIAWNDHTLQIDWPINKQIPILSSKDENGEKFANAELIRH